MTRPFLLLPVLGLSLRACPASAQQAYPTPEAAAEALVGALGSERADPAQLATVLGPDWGRYIPLDNVDRDDTDAFIARYREKHLIQQSDPGRAVLAVGKEGWTLPIPLVKGADGWAFDLAAVDDLLLEHAVVVADAVAVAGNAKGRHRIEETGSQAAQAAVAQCGVVFQVGEGGAVDAQFR